MTTAPGENDDAESIGIRRAMPADADTLTALMHASRAYQGKYASILDDYRIDARQIEADQIFVAERDGAIAGFYSLIVADGLAELDLLFVDESAQRRGVGARLFTHMRAIAASLGVRCVVIVSHPPAADFYRRMGAEDAGTVPPGGKAEWPRPILTLRIAPGSDSSGRVVLATGRLVLRELVPADAEFVFRLVNDPDWLHYIGDKGVRTLADARRYIATGPAAMIAQHGFGLWRVELRDGGQPIGVCGLIRREVLEDVDIGFAFLPAFRAQGYAREAAAATLAHARDAFGLDRVVAITSIDNESSAKLLEKIGLRFERIVDLGRGGDAVRLFAVDLASRADQD